MIKRAVIHFALAVLILSAGMLSAEQPSTNAVLRKGDALMVKLVGIANNPMPEYREIVDSDGCIELPYLNRYLSVEGLSRNEAASQMADAYRTAGISSNVTVQLTPIFHFEQAPERSSLVRAHGLRVPVPVEVEFNAE